MFENHFYRAYSILKIRYNYLQKSAKHIDTQFKSVILSVMSDSLGPHRIVAHQAPLSMEVSK